MFNARNENRAASSRLKPRKRAVNVDERELLRVPEHPSLQNFKNGVLVGARSAATFLRRACSVFQTWIVCAPACGSSPAEMARSGGPSPRADKIFVIKSE